MAALTKQVNNFQASKKLSKSSFGWEHTHGSVNQEMMDGMVIYLRYLYAKSLISDKTYEFMLLQVLSSFVENTIHLEFQQIFDKVDSALFDNILV